MKKIIALFAIVSVFGFVACNNAAEESEGDTSEDVENTDQQSTDEDMDATSDQETAPMNEDMDHSGDDAPMGTEGDMGNDDKAATDEKK
jgi:hypothetical protein